ncbi:MAG: helix-turn-helix domain-containing protein [Actinobacteria bacterium]|nr:helix-turn-helix domain-containing protein [Actinomycetota bacterium]
MNRQDLIASRGDQPLRRASDRTPLGRLVGGIERAFGTGDLELAAALLEQDPIAAWYGLRPDQLRTILTGLERQGIPGGGFARLMSAMFTGLDPSEIPTMLSEHASADAELHPSFLLAGQMFALRIQGRPAEALEVSARLDREYGTLEPFFGAFPGWSLFGAVQHGITAMLAGDFTDAMRGFAQARMHAGIPALAFLHRDALIKSALIEAVYGDPERARELLAEAAGLSRTESWAEPLVDAGGALAEALIDADEIDREDILLRLDAIPPEAVGEMWPFHIVAVQQTLRADGRHEEGQYRLEMAERMPLPRVDGDGFTGSVLPVLGAMGALVRGDLAGAREQLGRADASLPNTRLVAALTELAAGNPRAALQFVAGLSQQTRNLRRLDVWRLAITAAAHLALGAEDQCREVLEFALELPGGLRPYEVRCFSRRVRTLAEHSFEGWPRDELDSIDGSWQFPEGGETLTARELDLLRALVSGASREQIAKAQFISLNTLKAHLRSIYRKLGVNSRTGAVLEAERRGLV